MKTKNKKNILGFLKGRLLYKIMGAFLGVVLIAGAIHAIVMNLSITDAFERRLSYMGENAQNMQNMMGNIRGLNLYTNLRAAMNDSLLISALAAFAIAGLTALLISRRMTKPIENLTAASKKIAKGDYEHRIPDQSIPEDELGQLAISFNQMAEKLEGIESMRRQLIGDISHELRTPLTAIKGSMEGLMDGVLPADQNTYQQIYREADRLQRLVEDLQELSRVDGSLVSLNKKAVKAADLVKNAITPLENTFTMKNVALESQIEANLPKINVDTDRIQQVLQNLLGNALQFTPAGGHVFVKVLKEKDQILFSVQDDGIGISSKDLQHIFERFYRADKSRSRGNGGGSGIGLTIAKSLVEAHGGEIWAESAGKDRGSTFTFAIPLD